MASQGASLQNYNNELVKCAFLAPTESPICARLFPCTALCLVVSAVRLLQDGLCCNRTPFLGRGFVGLCM